MSVPAQLPEVSPPAVVLGCFCKAAAGSLVYSLISLVIALGWFTPDPSEGCSLAGTSQATGTPPHSGGCPDGGGNPKVAWLLVVRLGGGRVDGSTWARG